MFNFTPVVKNLLILNIGIYLIQRIEPSLTYYIGLFPPGTEGYIPTQLFTNVFAHSPMSWSHLIYNMISLIVFGPMLERVIGDKKFILLYIVAGLSATLLHVGIFDFYLQEPYFLLGASGAVMGVAVATAIFYPNMEMLIYFFFPIKIKYLVALYVAYDLYSGLNGSNTQIAHYAHLGGAISGFALGMYWKNSRSY